MKLLFIGGTGTISTAISRKILEAGEHELYIINRGNRNDCLPPGYKSIICDINDESAVSEKIADLEFDVVVDFIAFKPAQVERDYRLFTGKTKQYIYISSASAYQKPLSNYRITEDTPLVNPFWQYSRDKIACEEYLMKMYRDNGFPVTIVRPSHTYDERKIPIGFHGGSGSWPTIKRMLDGKQIIIHGDGRSLWTLTHSTDFADAFIGLLGNTQAIGEAVQITSDESLTWNQVYSTIAGILGVELKPYYVTSEFLEKCSPRDITGSMLGDKSNTVVFDNTKLKRLVPGFSAKLSYAQGVRMSIENHLADKSLQIEDPIYDAWCDKVISTLDKATEIACQGDRGMTHSYN